MTVTSAQATTLLENVLFESSTLAAANEAQWVATSQTNSAAGTIDGLAEVLAAAPEAGIAEQVVRYYEGALGRDPSASEIGYYVKIAETGLSASEIAQGASAVPTSTWSQIAGYFAASPEYQAMTSGGNVIPALYQNILGRAPSTDEVSFYQKAMDGGTTVSTLLQYFVNSAEYQNKVNAGIVANLAATGEVVLTGASVESVAGASGTSTITDGIGAAGVVDLNAGLSSLTINGLAHSTTLPSGTLTNLGLSGTDSVLATAATTAITVVGLNAGAVSVTAGLAAAASTIASSGPHTIVLSQMSSPTSVDITNGNSFPLTLDLSQLSGTSTPTYTLPTGTDNFTYDGITFHVVVGTASVELVGVSASQITFIPAHS